MRGYFPVRGLFENLAEPQPVSGIVPASPVERRRRCLGG